MACQWSFYFHGAGLSNFKVGQLLTLAVGDISGSITININWLGESISQGLVRDFCYMIQHKIPEIESNNDNDDLWHLST